MPRRPPAAHAACALACVGALLAAMPLATPSLAAQTLAAPDPVLQRIWRLGMDSSQSWPLAQALLDSVGPRLTGTPGQRAGNDWLLARYREWGITARAEQYGSWRGWRRGITHVDLVAPRVRTLEGTMLAWSPGTRGPVEGPAVLLPRVTTAAEFAAWLPQARGKFVLISFPQPTCRPDSSWRQFGTPETYERMQRERQQARDEWERRVAAAGLTPRDLPLRLEDAGALGVITSLWSQGWGVTKVFNARTRTVPTLELSCEDYGLVARLAERNQGPRLRVEAEAEALGEVPVANVIAEVRGVQRPDEYVMLSAHFDSWDGASGATDNGTGTVVMLEAMRILRQAYPRPRRTIVAGHWSGEEQGLVGSRSFAADNPKVVRGLQALFNQDNGTGRVSTISASGLTGAAPAWGRWMARLPSEITRHITLQLPGTPAGGGSDYASFVCYGAPGFGLSSNSWEYGTYTWHTNRDTFDKIAFDEVRNNATLVAMLAYLASEDPEVVGRERRAISGGEWPQCQAPPRRSADWTR